MEEPPPDELEIFQEAIRSENFEIQFKCTNHLSVIAKSIGVEKTKEELLPFLKENIDLHDEILLNISEQLKEFIPLVGGYENSQGVLDVLMRLCNTDETFVRNKAIETWKGFVADVNNDIVETLFIPRIEELANTEWFPAKCAAAALIPAFYQKVKEEKQTDLRNLFRILIQDETPIIRKEACIYLVELLPLLEKVHILNEFIPVFDNITKDTTESIRIFAADVAVALAKCLTEAEVDEFIFKTLENWAEDSSWKIRHKLALNIADIQKVIPYNKYRGKVLALYQKLVKDPEPEVRIAATRNLFSYCESFKKTYEGQDKLDENFEPVFVQSILPQIKHLTLDSSEEVRLALSSGVLTLSSLLRPELFKNHILPLIVEMFENEISMAIHANMWQNLNYLPANIDLTQSLHSIRNVVRSLIINSQSHWRARRSLLVAFIHLAKFADKEYFAENLKIYYAALLGDPIFAVRRTAALILPLLAKQYGMEWSFQNIIPFVSMFTKDIRYLYRYVPIFAIKELINPSVDPGFHNSSGKYLDSFKALLKSESKDVKDKIPKILANISKQTEKIRGKLEEQTCKDILSLNKSIDDFASDRISLYADETMDILKTSCDCNIFSLDEANLSQSNCTYLEGLLSLIYREFLALILNLFDDKIVNVQIRSIFILNEIDKFIGMLEIELKEPWVKDTLQTLTKDDLEEINKKVESEFSQRIIKVDDDMVNTELMEMSTDNQKVPEIKVERATVSDIDVLELNNSEKFVEAHEMKEMRHDIYGKTADQETEKTILERDSNNDSQDT